MEFSDDGALLRARTELIRVIRCVYASRLVVPAFQAAPDIHLRSRAPQSCHRRLSMCSLPVPKQFVESLGRVISFAQSPTCRTWQPAHRKILMFFPS